MSSCGHYNDDVCQPHQESSHQCEIYAMGQTYVLLAEQPFSSDHVSAYGDDHFHAMGLLFLN